MADTIRLEVRLQDAEPIPPEGARVAGGTVITSFPQLAGTEDGRWIILEVPDVVTPQALVADASTPIVAGHPEPIVYHAGECDWPPPTIAAGRTTREHREAHGITDTLVHYGAGGADRAIYVADTGAVRGGPGFRRNPSRLRWLDPGGSTEPRDSHGHGHWCTGTVAGELPDEPEDLALTGGVAYGVCPQADITAVLALPNPDGSGTVSGIAAAFRLALADMRARGYGEALLCASLGGPTSPVMRAAAAECALGGMVCCIAAGNSGNSAPLGSPADGQGVQAVNGAIGWGGGVSAFSQAVSDGRVTVYPICEEVPGPNKAGGMMYPSGTSMGPHMVAGSTALAANALGISLGEALGKIKATLALQAGSAGRRWTIDPVKLGLDLDGEGGDDVDVEGIQARCAQGRQLIVEAQGLRCPYWSDQPTYQGSMAAIMDTRIGPLDDLFREIDELTKT